RRILAYDTMSLALDDVIAATLDLGNGKLGVLGGALTVEEGICVAQDEMVVTRPRGITQLCHGLSLGHKQLEDPLESPERHQLSGLPQDEVQSSTLPLADGEPLKVALRLLEHADGFV